MKSPSVLFLGVGNMAGSILLGLKRGGTDLSTVTLYTPTKTKARKLAEELACLHLEELSASLDFDYIFLGMKPQQSGKAIEDLRTRLKGRPVLVSMMAGVSLESLTQGLGQRPLIRLMPNLACRVGQSVTPIMKNELVPDEEFNQFINWLAPLGVFLPLTSQELFDRTTVHFSSFPAYLYGLAYELEQALVVEGIGPDQARECVLALFSGSAKNMRDYDQSLLTLKNSVISKAGVTHAFLQALEGENFSHHFKKAIKAGQNRAFELSQSK